LQARVLLVTSEAVPLVKTGGLADAIGALAHTLHQQGIDVTVMLPGYPGAVKQTRELKEICTLEELPGGAGKLLHGKMPDTGVSVLLLDTPGFRSKTANPYVNEAGEEHKDNPVNFAALAFAATAICEGKTPLPVPHVVHANDWHAGLIPALVRHKKIKDVGTVQTIHNLAFQGNYAMELASEIGIPEALLTPDAMEFWGKMSYLKAGIRYADRVTTVSKTYAREILTPEFGHGMEGLLNAREKVLSAVPNGIDEALWNPAEDPLIARSFSLQDMKGKSACKRDLLKLFKMPSDPFAPILALGSRITHQKMADVALAALPAILKRHRRLQVVVLGCGEPQYEQGFLKLAEEFEGRVGIHIGYDEHLAHALHAGADMLLHGSRFEPYGLTPLYSLRYGTIPIASRVGGLSDTIADAGLSGPPPTNATGVLFDGQQAEDMIAAVFRACELYSEAAEWQAMQHNAMSANFSWEGPARAYIRLYQEIAPSVAKPAFAPAPIAPEKLDAITLPERKPVAIPVPVAAYAPA
jgi:starch synthase